MRGALEAHLRVVDLLQQGADVLLHGVAVPRGVGAARQEGVNAPRRAAAEHEGHPGPAVVLRCRRRLQSQLAGERCARTCSALTPRGNLLAPRRNPYDQPRGRDFAGAVAGSWCLWHYLKRVCAWRLLQEAEPTSWGP